jgi:hypothetical protein
LKIGSMAVRNTVFLSSCRCSLDAPTPPFLGMKRASQSLACIPRTTTSDNANYQSWFWSHAKRAKHEAPRHSHFQLGGQFRSLVRTLCVRQGSWVKCRNFYSKWQPHLIYIYATAILHFITAHTSGHNSGPDALARRQCRAHVLAMLGRGAGRARSAVPRSDRAKSKRARSALALALAAKAL